MAARILDALLGLREEDAAEEMDPTVREYVEGLIAESLVAGGDGLDDLFESCGDFIPGFAASQEQFRAVIQAEGQAGARAQEEGASPLPRGNADAPATAPPPAEHPSPASTPPPAARPAHSTPPPRQQAAACCPRPEAGGGSQAHAGGGRQTGRTALSNGAPTSVEEEVVFLLGLAGATVDDATVLAYLGSVARDAVAEDGALDDLVDVFCGVVPELQALDHPRDEAFGYFFDRVRALHEEGVRRRQACAAAEAAASHGQPGSARKAEECGEEEDDDDDEDEDEEDWTGSSEQLLTLREVFPTATRAELEAALALAGNDMEVAIDKVVQFLEFQAISVSAEARRAEAQSFEQEATEAARERALARYNTMSEACASERGKKGVNVEKVIRVRDEAIEHSIKKMMESQEPQRRYVNNEVVSHKGESASCT